jgi:hypothetical protein
VTVAIEADNWPMGAWERMNFAAPDTVPASGRCYVFIVRRLGIVAPAIVAATAVVACGTAATTPQGAEGGLDASGSADVGVIVDASTDASVVNEAGFEAEAEMFPCWSALCTATQVCIFPLEECSVPGEAPTDAGTCPDGTVPAPEIGPGCYGSPGCLKGFAPFCGSQDQCAQDAALWDYIFAHLDAGDSTRVCAAEPPP